MQDSTAVSTFNSTLTGYQGIESGGQRKHVFRFRSRALTCQISIKVPPNSTLTEFVSVWDGLSNGLTIRRLYLNTFVGIFSYPADCRLELTWRRMFRSCLRTGAYGSKGMSHSSLLSLFTERWHAIDMKYALRFWYCSRPI